MAVSGVGGHCIKARLLETHVENATTTSEIFTRDREFADYLKNIEIVINQMNVDEVHFDMVGIDPVIANTLRRILIAETPSMAIDHIFITQNTSIFQDEILAHRIGLIPIKADANDFQMRSRDDLEGGEDDTIEFRLKISCHNKTGNSKDRGTAGKKVKSEKSSLSSMGVGSEAESVERYSVLSKEIEWVPRGSQRERYPDGIHAALGDIVIAKLVPGQEIDAVLHGVKGIGKDHAKFSPVGTAYYRFLPEIILKEIIEGELAVTLQNCFPKGVIGIIDKKGRRVAMVEDVRKDNANGNVLLNETLSKMVELNKIKNHVIFTVESVGMMPASQLVKTACRVMIDKCSSLLSALDDDVEVDGE